MARILLLHPDATKRSWYRKVLQAEGHDVSESAATIGDLIDRDSRLYDRIELHIPDVTQDAVESSLMAHHHREC